jgi:serine protease Do
MRSFLLLALACGVMLLPVRFVAGQALCPTRLGIATQLQSAKSHLGVGLRDVDPDRARELNMEDARGAEVVHVLEGSPAERAGLKPGDVLLTYNGENILGAMQLGRLVAETPAGRKVKIQYWRNGKVQTATVITDAAKGSGANFPSVFSGPELPNWAITDVPSPLLVWKNAVLGIECEPVDSQLAKYFGVKDGVLVRSVDKDSAGYKAGLRAGDVITAIGDHRVAEPRDVISYMRMQHQPGKPIPIALTREHNQLSLVVLPR